MNRRGLTWATGVARGICCLNSNILYENSSILGNPSLVTDTPGASVSGETMQKHWILSKTGRAREVSRLGDRGCAGPNEVGFLVWSCNWNF